MTPAELPANSLGGFVERMWAYLSIKKAQEEAEVEADPGKASELRDKAKRLALKYNFVTAQTSLVIVDDEAQPTKPSIR